MRLKVQKIRTTRVFFAIFGAASVQASAMPIWELGRVPKFKPSRSHEDLDQMLIWMLKSRSSDQSISWFEIFWSYPQVLRCHDRQADINIWSSGLEGDQPHHKYGSERKEIWDKSIRQAVDQNMRGLTSFKKWVVGLKHVQ